MRWLIGLVVMLSFNTMASDICLDWDSRSSYNCSSYTYQNLPVYFLDRNGVEQKFFAKKVIQANNGEFIYANYEFNVTCTINCGDTKNVTDQYLEDWRFALINQETYTYEITSPCTKLTCDNTEPLSVGGIGDSSVYANTKTKIGLDTAESVTTTVNNTMNTINTAFQIKNELNKNASSVSNSSRVRFIIVKPRGFGDPTICDLQGDTCLEADVDISDYGDDGFEANINNARSEREITAMIELMQNYISLRPLQCVNNTTCSTTSAGVKTCTASFTCFRQKAVVVKSNYKRAQMSALFFTFRFF